MEFSDFTIRLIIILIPGAIATITVDTLTLHKKWTTIYFFINSIILGGISYFALQLFWWLILWIVSLTDNFTTVESLNIWKSIISTNGKLEFIEVLACIPVSIIVGIIISYIVQKKIVFKIATKYGISRKFGDDSLYYYFLNKDNVDWVYLRDIPNNLSYRGQVISFSEDESNKEIVLRNVTVYNYKDSLELYSVEQIYLKFQSRDMIIEIPTIEIIKQTNKNI